MPIEVPKVKIGIDPAFEVRMPNEGKNSLYAVIVMVEGYNPQSALLNFSNGRVHGAYSVHGVEQVVENDGRIKYELSKEPCLLDGDKESVSKETQ